jgi:hypothetical protein
MSNEIAGPPTVEVTALSPHTQAIYEAGKALLVESIKVGRDFCQYMVGASAGSIPVYLGLLKFLLPEHYKLAPQSAMLLVVPTLVFLGAATIFAVGYFPTAEHISLDLPDEIERVRRDSIGRRRRFATTGFVVFSIGCIAAIAGCVAAIVS